MKKILLVIWTLLLCVTQECNSQVVNKLPSFEQLSYQQVYEKYQSLQIQNTRIKENLFNEAPDYVYEEYCKEQSIWDKSKNQELQQSILTHNKDQLCKIVYMDYLRIGMLLTKYSEFLPKN
jgi:hypothetical protein